MPWTDPAKRAEYQRRYNSRPEIRERNRTRNRKYMREWNVANKDRVNLKRRCLSKGIEPGSFQTMYDAQQGRCCVCGLAPEGRQQFNKLVIDHDHETGKVRGLLCGMCNTSLGYAEDSPERLRALADYLERTR